MARRSHNRAHDKLGTKFDAAPYAAHATNEMRAGHARRHEIDHDGNTIGGLDRGFENQRMATIISRHFSAGVCRLDRPSPVVLCAEEIGETSGRIETWPAKPVDGQVAPDEGRRLAIANDRIILDVHRHRSASGVNISENGHRHVNEQTAQPISKGIDAPISVKWFWGAKS